MPNNSNTINLAAVNHATGEATIYVNENATLDVTLTNATGGGITLQAGGTPSTFLIFMPTYFTASELQNMQIALTNWSFSSDGQSLTLTYNGAGETWAEGANIAFQITNVLSDASPTTDSIQINFSNLGGSNIPLQVQTPLSLSNPPQPGNASLETVLQVSLDNQGSIYISDPNDPLQNSLFLNIKNTGATNLYTGTNMWTGNPQVIVTFIYGSTSGALAPDNDKNSPLIGSAWNILGSLYIDQTAGWQITNPSNTGVAPHPKWIMNPANTNQAILGTGANANVTFDFSKIVSQTPPGHTQMVVQFTGFMKDDNTHYDDHVFTVDIVKQEAPPTRGMINFFGEQPIITINEPSENIEIPLRWAMFDVDSINLITSYPGMNAVIRNYPNPQPLAYDNAQITIPGATNSAGLFCTIQAFDGNGSYLNSLQFTAFIQANFFYDTRDNKVYPVVQIGNKIWMASNLDYNAPSGSDFYAGNSAYESQYGRLYNLQTAQSNIPAGWRLPTQDDWNDLISESGSTPQQAYTALLAGGSSGFNAQLGGSINNSGSSSQITVYGFYWTSTPKTASESYYAGFSSNSSSVSTAASNPNNYMCSVRYVKDVN